MVVEFNKDIVQSSQFGNRTFLKPHKNSIIDFMFNEGINYSKNGCAEIDNMDILCKVSKIKLYSGGDTIVYNYFGKTIKTSSE